MLVIILPYQAHPMVSRPRPEDAFPIEKALARLQTYLGELPSGSKILIDRDREGRDVAAFLVKTLENAEVLRFAWRQPGNRRQPNMEKFEQVFHAIETLETPLLIMVTPTSLAARYIERAAQIMDIRSINLPQSLRSKILVLDRAASDGLRVIAFSGN